MKNDLELGIATVFRDATMESITLELRTEADWDQFFGIQKEARLRETDELTSFDRDKPELLIRARKDIIDKAGSLTFEHPTPFGTDKFATSTTDEQANTKVENNHQARLLGIVTEETDAYDNLKQEIHAREGVQDQKRSPDRRNDEERRTPSRDR